jgi:16S rRNA processing protein RimM
MKEPVVIGKVVGVFGLKGILKVWPDTDFPERFDEGRTVLIGETPYEIVETRWHKQQARIRVKGITKIAQGEALIGAPVSVPADDVPTLEEGQYMIDDLIGVEVFDESGKRLGAVDQVVRGAQDLYEVSGVLVPAVKEFVLEVDIAARRMVIRPIAGMFEDQV